MAAVDIEQGSEARAGFKKESLTVRSTAHSTAHATAHSTRRSAVKLLALAFSVALLCFWCTGCAPKIPREALQLQPESLALRQLQTRRFDTDDEASLLMAGASLLQDMGFQIEDSESSLGVLIGSKDTDAREAGEIVGAVLVAAFLGTNVPWAQTQKVKASLVTRPINGSQSSFRVTFQRIVWNNHGQVHLVEGLTDPSLYQDFFEKLSKALFLEANQI